MTEEMMEAVWSAAVDALKSVAENEDCIPADRIAASKVLIEALHSQYDVRRKAALTASVLPLLKRTMRSLSGDLTSEEDFAPVFELDAAEQANFVLQLTRHIEK